MRLGSGLLIPPLAFMALLMANYGIEPWACEYQVRWPLHVSSAIGLLVVLGAGTLAWREWKEVGLGARDARRADAPRVRFLAAMALMLGALMALATIALWTTILIMPPCVR